VGALVALALVLLGMTLSYVFLVVRDDPLVQGSTGYHPSIGSEVPGADPPDTGAWVIEYQDGVDFTMALWVRNNGRFALTVTGVETDPSYWNGLVKLTDARAGVIQGPAPCCIVNSQASWALPRFVPFGLDRDKEAPILLRFRLQACEHNGVGVSNTLHGFKVDYDVLGNGHTTLIPFEERLIVRYTSAAECPRPPTYPQGNQPPPQLQATPASQPPTR
jgi:hypothetical protein